MSGKHPKYWELHNTTYYYYHYCIDRHYVRKYYIHKYYICKYYIHKYYISKNYKSTYGLIWEQVLYIFAKLLIVWGGRDPIETKDPGIWMCRDLNVSEGLGI